MLLLLFPISFICFRFKDFLVALRVNLLRFFKLSAHFLPFVPFVAVFTDFFRLFKILNLTPIE